MAVRLRRELQTDVNVIQGRYGQFKAAVDGDIVSDGGAAAFMGIMPSRTKIVAAVKGRLEGPRDEYSSRDRADAERRCDAARTAFAAPVGLHRALRSTGRPATSIVSP